MGTDKTIIGLDEKKIVEWFVHNFVNDYQRCCINSRSSFMMKYSALPRFVSYVNTLVIATLYTTFSEILGTKHYTGYYRLSIEPYNDVSNSLVVDYYIGSDTITNNDVFITPIEYAETINANIARQKESIAKKLDEKMKKYDYKPLEEYFINCYENFYNVNYTDIIIPSEYIKEDNIIHVQYYEDEHKHTLQRIMETIITMFKEYLEQQQTSYSDCFAFDSANYFSIVVSF